MMQKLLIVLLLVALSKYDVNSLHTEGIVGGYLTEEGQFKYQITLNVLLPPRGPDSIMLCTGAIIHKQYIITAANCVVKKTENPIGGLFFKRWYTVTSGTRDLKLRSALLDKIVDIFVPEDYNPYTQIADLAVIKLKEEIDLNDFPQLGILELPDEHTIDENLLLANVSGFGFYIIHEDGSGLTDYKLKYLKENITSIDECKQLTRLHSDKYLCAKSIPDNPDDNWGICKGDVGAPLVYGTKLLGIASRIMTNCVDTVFPSLYTRVKPYVRFIRNVIEGTPLPGTRHFSYPVF